MTDKHQQKMAAKKAVMDAKIAKATEERGILILMKGNGKGKSSSAFGTLARSLGHGKRCAVVQFLKGRNETGEYKFFRDHPMVDWHVMGDGFTWETQNKEQDIAAAERAWETAKPYLSNPDYDLLIFDEMSYMFKYQYLDVEPVVAALQQRPPHQNVIITGRTMATPLQDIADTISSVQDERHAFRLGVKAQLGIEF
ncbi:MAG: cob(I)yrinic acid a,c-diamide adenosyltransferase [Pseudomonadales bacterium]|jgi:cob(I)alamin adenosyltransferase|uniref:cob(I)yrinic acid a,c-diamide adenosyltransferase n=1 Tax=unclassified Ketobacter TaxID=2639109 RepID=UPI000C5B9577|nr:MULTISPECIES: cob(I)yrinic acid a,c-diamide adenosyltransferase [unclassified Ketobacter]MAA61103.1 cob(I)yrinic acid a,c-diamide adenosyltransferase [Pseudomonadales bacterium]MEC8810785.1 cob(I)yrinic acid a,c-diamide adenosyltransferase [Pseudomonadota bacterium]TNC90746.1 MAG: cob(I)yrinic acid a,c-diamide adenosyltransferase [Alcanivorax sp.]HAG94934.1 cob(I)yrinic acid a,c-diamide adenosyltransferase [Gammaproteobacteria bacterium]MAQ22895.1 cob(I)yrinic acid a,c-diamide adenosyltrans|tara:strand:+ start:142 stop:732 length:591 start_codon:yes stop_codon:yes gene_type:complete